MAKQEITLKGLDGQEDHLVYDATNGQVGDSLEECARSLFPQEGETTPRLRFQGFEGEWKLVRLGDVGTFRSNGVDKKIYPGEDIVNLLNYMDVFNFRKVTQSNCKDLMQVSASPRQIEECDIKAGDIFFTPSSETAEDIGHVMVVEEDLPNTCYSYHLMRYRPNPGVFYPTFPDYGFQTFFLREQMRIAAKGVQRFVLGKNDFESLMVYVPCIEEQEKIATFFARLESEIALRKAQYEHLTQMKHACLNTMFPKQNEITPPIRFSGYDGEWKKIRLADIAKFSKGSGYSKNDLVDAGTPIILYGRMYTKYETMIKDVDTFANENDNSILSKGNEIIIPASGETPEDIACASVVARPGIILGGDLNIIRLSSEYDPVFTALSITYGDVHSELAKYAQGKTIVHLHNAEISNVSICYPKDFNEQKQISNYFLAIDSQIHVEQQRLDNLRQMKIACLENMFPRSGEITPPHSV